MSNFANSYLKYANHLKKINEAARSAPERLVQEIEESYREQLHMAADKIERSRHDYRIVLLAGPSSSGKTTTATRLCACLTERGIDNTLISLDDFYRGANEAPLLENGHYDYESVEALDLPKLEECMRGLVESNRCVMPLFDFYQRKPSGKSREVVLKEHGIAVVEGIHALNPKICAHLPQDKIFKVYVSVKQGIKNKREKILSAEDIRFIRRLVRDNSFRSTPPERTLQMWPNVIAGENKYIKPYKYECDITINSIHIYEPCVLKHRAIPLLNQLIADKVPEEEDLRRMTSALNLFESISEDLVPQDSIIREFIGPTQK